jgi:hypothetical protein
MVLIVATCAKKEQPAGPERTTEETKPEEKAYEKALEKAPEKK